MKMAKASKKDIDAAGDAMSVLSDISSGYYPKRGGDDCEDTFFDPGEFSHLRRFYDLMNSTLDASPGWPGRVIGGMCFVILYDKNKIVSQDADTLELHPRFAEASEQLDALQAENTRLRAELEAVGAGGVQPLRAEAGWVLVPVERVHHWIVPDFGYLFPTEDAARRYLENIGADALPTACYTAPQQAAPQAQPAVEPAAWLPMDAAPKDGTLVRLLVEFEDHATEDGPGPHPTIGANTSENDKGPDEWQFAGWNWEHDCFTQGVGTPVGWLPMTQCVPAFKAPAQEGGEA